MVKRPLLLVASVVLLVAGLRFALVASQCELGWAYVLTQWQDASLGPVGLGHTPIGHSAPSQQARFWLDEVERITDDHPDSASIHMGAAWILDSPANGFLQKHIRPSDFASVLPFLAIKLDEEAISEAKAEFRELCADRCLEMARAATQNNPADVRWWRMRALLLFDGDAVFGGEDFSPRSKSWLATLDECRTHDPENALYDYLAALLLWRESASYELPDEPEDVVDGEEWIDFSADEEEEGEAVSESKEDDESWLLTIHNPDRFGEGRERFLAAQRLPYLAIGEAGYPAISEFVAASHVRRIEQTECALSRLVTLRHFMIVHRLLHWQTVRADNARSSGDREREMAALRQSLRLYDQAISPSETSALNVLTTFGRLRSGVFQRVLNLHKASPELIAAGELQAIEQHEKELRIAALTLEKAMRNLHYEASARQYASSWEAVFSICASQSVSALLIASGLLLLTARLLGVHSFDASKLGVWRHLVIWVIAYSAAFTALGLAPAEVIRPDKQRMAIICGVWLVAASVITATAFYASKFMRGKRLRFRLATLLAAMSTVAVFSALWPLAAVVLDWQLPSELSIHAIGWNGFDAQVIRSSMGLKSGSWHWAVLQWLAHSGQYLAIVAALLLTAGWFCWRSASQVSEWPLSYFTTDLRSRWSRLFHIVGRSALGASLCWLLLYFLVAPRALLLAEAEFQHKMRYTRNPGAHWAEIRDARNTIAESEEATAEILELVEFEFSGKELLEKDFSSQ